MRLIGHLMLLSVLSHCGSTQHPGAAPPSPHPSSAQSRLERPSTGANALNDVDAVGLGSTPVGDSDLLAPSERDDSMPAYNGPTRAVEIITFPAGADVRHFLTFLGRTPVTVRVPLVEEWDLQIERFGYLPVTEHVRRGVRRVEIVLTSDHPPVVHEE
jgi:hypothetical protein